MQGRVRRIMEKVATAPKPHPGAIRLDAKCYSAPRPRRRESAVSTIAGNLSMSTIAQSPEHSSMNHSMGSFLNHGRDTLLPDDFNASAMASRRTTAVANKRKSPSKQAAAAKHPKGKGAAKKAKAKPTVEASPSRRSARVAAAPRPNYAEDGGEDDDGDDHDLNSTPPRRTKSTAVDAGTEADNDDDEGGDGEESASDAGSVGADEEEEDQENDERQARRTRNRSNVSPGLKQKRKPAASRTTRAKAGASPAKAKKAKQQKGKASTKQKKTAMIVTAARSFRSTRARRRR